MYKWPRGVEKLLIRLGGVGGHPRAPALAREAVYVCLSSSSYSRTIFTGEVRRWKILWWSRFIGLAVLQGQTGTGFRG